MRILPRLLTFLTASSVLVLTWWAVRAPGSITVRAVQATAQPTTNPANMSGSKESWITVDLPPDATQLEYGAEIYRLVCSACHAYDGTGLTDEWRATWDPDSQNCWQSKCHGENHPQDGFFLPDSPAIVGPVIPALFANAYELYEYIYIYQPWYNPNSLTEEEAWAVTAYVLALNRFDPGLLLDAETAPKLRLRSETADVAPPPIPTATSLPTIAPDVNEPQNSGLLPAIILISILSVGGYIFVRRYLRSEMPR